MGADTKRIAMVAGESSGDLLAAHLMRALRARREDLAFCGIGGPRMIAEGFESWFDMEKLSVRGYVEVLRHYGEIRSIHDRLADRLQSDPPDLFIGVDAPDFNLPLERILKRAGVQTVHYVGPSVWAWRRWRLKNIARSASRMLLLFPFEPELYAAAGVPATYVGHPLADEIPLEPDRAEARAQLKVPMNRTVVALLPGSRQSELQYMAELFVKTARRVHEELPGVRFVCPLATRQTREQFAEALRLHAGVELPITLLFGHSHDALAAADVALVASGTATLEAALFKTPMIITYKVSPITYHLVRRMLYLPYVGLPNVLAGEALVPEHLQGAATPGALSAALLDLVKDAGARRRQLEKFREIHLTLRRGAAERAAEAVLEMLEGVHA